MTQAINPDAYLLMMCAKYGEQYGVGESLLQQMTKSELDFLFALRKEIDCCPECRICQGETVYIGTLGSSLIYRCRHCGIETFKRLEMPNEEPECPQCDGADNQPDLDELQKAVINTKKPLDAMRFRLADKYGVEAHMGRALQFVITPKESEAFDLMLNAYDEALMAFEYAQENETMTQENEQERIGNLFAECVDDLYKCKEALELLDEKFEQIRCQEESMAQENKRAFNTTPEKN